MIWKDINVYGSVVQADDETVEYDPIFISICITCIFTQEIA